MACNSRKEKEEEEEADDAEALLNVEPATIDVGIGDAMSKSNVLVIVFVDSERFE